jgi:hypothetical protein
MIHRFFLFLLALFYGITGSSQIIWAEESTGFDLYFKPIALIALSEQEIELSPSVTTAAGSPVFTDSLATTFHLRYSISPVHTNPQLVHTASLPAGLSSRWYTTSFIPESGICTLAPSATHNGTNQFLTAAIYGHSGTAPQDGIPVTLRIALSRSQYQNLDANLHLINLTYQCL